MSWYTTFVEDVKHGSVVRRPHETVEWVVCTDYGSTVLLAARFADRDPIFVFPWSRIEVFYQDRT